MKSIRSYAIFLLVAFMPAYAHAGLLTEISTLLSTYITPTDESIGMLKSVFGDFALDPFNSGGAVSTSGAVLGEMFGQYNMFVFTVAMMWFSYTAFASLAQTMHEGVVLGQRMSTVWVPLRIAFGAASLMPVFGGWAFCQALMMITATLGIAGANSITGVAINSTSQFQTIVSPMGGVKQAASLNNIELNVLQMVSCQEAAGAIHAEAAANGIQFAGDAKPSFLHYLYAEKTKIVMQFPAADGDAACGAVNLEFSPREDASLQSAFGFRVAGINYGAIRDLSKAAHRATLETLVAQARTIVQGAQAVNAGNDLTAIKLIGDGYFGSYSRTFQAKLAQLQSDANNVSNKRAIDEALLDKMRSGGWATLGIWYGVFAEANEAMNEMLDPVITFDNPTIANSTENVLNSKLVSLIAKAKAREKLQPSNSMTSATGNTSLGQYILGGAINALAGGSSTGANGNVNAIIVFKNIGDNGLALVTAGFAAYEGAKLAAQAKNLTPVGAATSMVGAVVEKTLTTAANTAKPKSGFGSILSGLTTEAATSGGKVFVTAMYALFAAAALMAFYLPMLPFIQWFASLAHWFISIVESFLGASLWALAHFDTDGEGMGSRASYGYQYMLSNFARPIINTFAFFIASAAVTVLGGFLFKYFGSAIASAQGNTMTGLLSIVAYLVILSVMGIALVNNCFGVMLKMSDTIIGFIGSSAASAFHNDAEARINTMFIAGTSKMGQGMRSQAGGGGGGLGGKNTSPSNGALGHVPGTGGDQKTKF